MSRLPSDYYHPDGRLKTLAERQNERSEQERVRKEKEREQQRANFDPFAGHSDAELRAHYAQRRAERIAADDAKKETEQKRKQEEAQKRAEAARANPYAARLRMAEESGERLPEARRKRLKQQAKARQEQIRSERDQAEKRKLLTESDAYQRAVKSHSALTKLAIDLGHGDPATAPETLGRLRGLIEGGALDEFWSESMTYQNTLIHRMGEKMQAQRSAFVEAGDDLQASQQQAAEVLAELEQPKDE